MSRKLNKAAILKVKEEEKAIHSTKKSEISVRIVACSKAKQEKRKSKSFYAQISKDVSLCSKEEKTSGKVHHM